MSIRQQSQTSVLGGWSPAAFTFVPRPTPRVPGGQIWPAATFTWPSKLRITSTSSSGFSQIGKIHTNQ